MLNSFFLNIRSWFAAIRILFEVQKWPRRPGDDTQWPPSLLRHLITQQVVHVRPSGNHQRESAHLPTTTDTSSKPPTTDSKDPDRCLTIISRHAGYFDVATGLETPRWVGWTGIGGCASRLTLLLIGFEYCQTNVKYRYLGKIANVIVAWWLVKHKWYYTTLQNLKIQYIRLSKKIPSSFHNFFFSNGSLLQ